MVNFFTVYCEYKIIMDSHDGVKFFMLFDGTR